MKTQRPQLDRYALEKLKVGLSEKTGWIVGNKPDCAKLAAVIADAGYGQLSESTLYRLFFKSESHQPYKHTIDTVCRFMGYRDCQAFLDKLAEEKEYLCAMGVPPGRPARPSLLYYCIEHASDRPLHDFFESVDDLEHPFKFDLSVALFDALMMTARPTWFFERFVRQKYVRAYIFENGHDPHFRIKGYSYAYQLYLEGLDKDRDLHQFQSYLFGKSVLFRHYFLTRQKQRAQDLGDKLFVDLHKLEDVAPRMYIFPYIRYTAYRLWYLEMTGASPGAREEYAWFLLDVCRRLKTGHASMERKVLFHTIAETFLHATLSESFHWELKSLYKEEFDRLPDLVFLKNLRYSLPYFECNGMLYYRP